MCFSANASFAIAAATSVVGLVTLRQITHPKEILLAVMPFLFAIQQLVEGLLWLQLTGKGDPEIISLLSLIFQIFAKMLWPAYVALAVYLVEIKKNRKNILLALTIVGFLLSINLMFDLYGTPIYAAVNGHSIDYSSEATILYWQMLPYFLCTIGAFFLSSHKFIQVFGAVILFGFAVSAMAYLATFTSVWCFFAAAASTILYFHFKRTVPLEQSLIKN